MYKVVFVFLYVHHGERNVRTHSQQSLFNSAGPCPNKMPGPQRFVATASKHANK